jgi:hypothetical protein
MAYNLGMTQITLALPFALPPPEMAPDLLRALQTPALATLLSRHSKVAGYSFDNTGRVLPHEAWLAHALGLAPAVDKANADAGAPLAAAALRGFGLGTEEGYWFILQPAHVQISRTHMLLSDPRQLRLDPADSRALFDLMHPYVAELGKTLVYGDAGTWFLRADDWSGLRTTTSDAVLGQSLSDWLPEGEHSRDYRKLQNETQMLWHEHPVNEARQARGLQMINSFWLWGGAAANRVPTQTRPVYIAGGPAWMQALAEPAHRQPTATQVIAHARAEGHANALLADLIPDAIAGDWSAWLAQMQRLEHEWFAPLLAALKEGSLDKLTLIPGHRDGWLEASTSKLAQRKFWRKPNLNTLNTPLSTL